MKNITLVYDRAFVSKSNVATAHLTTAELQDIVIRSIKKSLHVS
jgi:hypothetical protein